MYYGRPDARTGLNLSVLEVNSISFARDSLPVVQDLSFSVNEGEIVGLLGPNGAGKSTTFGLLMGLLPLTGGSISLFGKPVGGPVHARVRAGMGWLPQESTVFHGLSVRDNLMIAAEACHARGNESSARGSVDTVLQNVGLTGLASRKVETLSGGERRRVEIARCLTTNPKILLLDEPFAGLDPIVVNELCGLFQGLAKQGFALLITDHAVRETLSICNRVLLLQRGRVVVSGSPADVSKSEAARHQWLGSRWDAGQS